MNNLKLVFYFIATILIGVFAVHLLTSSDIESSDYLRENYSKHQYNVPMRDGKELFTTVYVPKDTSDEYPFLMWRTPYSVSPYDKNEFPVRRTGSWHHLAREGFIFVFQDVRGRFMSEGTYVNMRPHIVDKNDKNDVDESSDTYDTIDWLLKNNKHHNGRVGIWGISYPGFYAAMGAINAHPALKAVSPQAPIANWFVGDDFHHNGAFTSITAFDFFTVFGVPRTGLIKEWPQRFVYNNPDGYKFYLNMGPLANANKKYLNNKIPFWNKMMEHGTYDDFWQSRNSLQYFHNIKPAVMTVGGWFDAENCYGALNTYKSIEEKNPDANNILVMGPWYHGGWVRSDGSDLGDIDFGSKTGEYYIKNIELLFFNYYLKDKGDIDLPEAYIFETGSNRWKKYDTWPPEDLQKQSIYFDKNGKLVFSESDENNGITFDEYVSDPAKPVPFTAEITTDMPKKYMVEDQRFVANRPDVLVFTSDVMEEDLNVIGPIKVNLYVSTSGTDSDWIVKLIDVFPDSTTEMDVFKMGGYQMLIRGDIMRGKFRNSYENPEPMEPNEVTKIEFTLNDIAHTFKERHKIMIQVQSTWFPLFDRNPQNFVDIYIATENDFQKARQRVYFSEEYPSSIELNILE